MSVTYPGLASPGADDPTRLDREARGVLAPSRPSATTTAALLRVAERVPTEASAYEFLENLRWRGAPVCPHCGSEGNHVFLRPANGLSRTTNRGKQSERRVWKCRECKRQFSVITGTVMHGTHVPIRTWVLVTFEIASLGNTLSERDVQRRYGLSSKSAHFLLQRIRDDLRRPEEESLFAAVVGLQPPPESVLVGATWSESAHDATRPVEPLPDEVGIISMW